MADAITASGSVGSGDGFFVTEVPAYVELKAPAVLCVGDRVDIAATVVIPRLEVRNWLSAGGFCLFVLLLHSALKLRVLRLPLRDRVKLCVCASSEIQ